MTDHDHLSNPSNDHTNDPTADARVDALARAAAGELRRPAPADGIARIERAKRRRQATQLGGAGVAVVAILAVGALAIGGGDAGPTVVPATVSTIETTDTTTPDTTVPDRVPGSLPDTVPETTEPPFITLPTPDSVPPNAAGSPTAVYTSAVLASGGGDQTLVDPVTGAQLGVEPIDSTRSLKAQQALLGATFLDGRSDTWPLPGGIGYEFDLQGVRLAYEALPTENPSLEDQDPNALPRFDRCGQSTLTVTGASATALPERVQEVAVSADGRWIITSSVDCQELGTLVDGYSVLPSPTTFRLFDASDLAAEGRLLMEVEDRTGVFASITFSPDGRFAAIAVSGVSDYRFFDTSDGAEVVPAAGCDNVSTRHTSLLGPWIGASSIALQLTCGTEQSLLVRDLVGGEQIDVDLPVVGDGFVYTVADVDHAHYERPANVWFTLCMPEQGICYLGQGAGPLTSLPGTAEASFLPLGFAPGG